MDEKQAIIDEARQLLQEVYENYKDKGILSIYLWGSITRDDFNPAISDIDALAIVNQSIDLSARSDINQWLKAHFSTDRKFGIQFYGIEELNGGPSYTVLSKFQPAGYLLLRFDDWIHAAGKQYQRADFSVANMTPEEARAHQLAQSLRALRIVNGELPIDEGRHGLESMCEDVVKGAIGALYWEAVAKGYTEKLNYSVLPSIVDDSRKDIATKLISIREKNNYTPEAILALRPLIIGLQD